MSYLPLWTLAFEVLRATAQIELYDDGDCSGTATSWSPHHTADFRNCSCVSGTRTTASQQQAMSWLVSCTSDGRTDFTWHHSDDCGASSIIAMHFLSAGHSLSGECVIYSERITMANRSIKILNPAQVQFPECGNGVTCLNERASTIAVGAAMPTATTFSLVSLAACWL